MKVKEFIRQYKDYSIELYGKPLNELTIPFTHIPKNKKLEECEVIDYVVEENEHEIQRVRFNDLKWYKTEIKKGYVRAYIK